GDERHARDRDDASLQILTASELDRVRQRIDPADVARSVGGDAQPAPLAHREAGGAGVLTEASTVAVDDRSRCGSPSGTLPERVPVVAAGDEADLLALGLVRRRQPERTSDLADLRLRQLAQREA